MNDFLLTPGSKMQNIYPTIPFIYFRVPTKMFKTQDLKKVKPKYRIFSQQDAYNLMIDEWNTPPLFYYSQSNYRVLKAAHKLLMTCNVSAHLRSVYIYMTQVLSIELVYICMPW